MDTKALRQKILDLAIRGKLVPQNPEDEPASVLLERIRLEKRQMVKDGKLKAKDIKNDSVIFVGEDSLHYEKFADGTVKCIEDEIPFEVPEGWALLRLQTFIKFVGGNQPPKSTFENIQTKDNIRLIQIRDYKSDKYITFIPRSKAKRFCTKEDVMIGRYGPPIFQILRGLEGAYNVALMKAIVNQDIMSNDYMYYMLQDGELLQRLESKSARTCGQDGINMYELNQYIVGIPPIREQKRIINFLTESLPIVNKISNSQDELSKLIQETKKKVLNLAIRGKLVPQKPDDEPASVLLEHIRDKKEHLIKEGKIKRDKKESTIFKSEDNSYYEKFADGTIKCIDEEIPFEIPDTWEWTRLKNCCSKEIKRVKSPKYVEKSKTLVFAQKCNTKYNGIDIKLALCLDENMLNKYPVDEYMCNGDIVINSTGTGTLGRVGYYQLSDNLEGYPIVPDSHITIIRACDNIHTFYLYIFMKANQGNLEEKGEGSTNQ